MGNIRLGRVGYLGSIAILLAVQAAPAYVPTLASSVGLLAAWVVAWQMVKVVPTLWRLNDVGHRPSTAVFLVPLPLLNLFVLRRYTLGGTPSNEVRDRRRALWVGRPGPFELIAGGARLAALTATVGVPVTLVFALVGALGAKLCLMSVDAFVALPATTQDLTLQVGFGAAAFLGVYTVVNFFKRQRATRASWLPSLLFVPVLVSTLSGWILHSGSTGLGPLAVQLPVMGWYLGYGSIAGAAVAIAWVRAGAAAHRGEPVVAGEVLREVVARTREVAGPHGAKIHAVTIGMQVVIPGIFYALQYAFVDMIAVLETDQPALRRSGRLSWPVRPVIFQVLLVWFLVANGIYWGVAAAMEAPETLGAAFFDPRVLRPTTLLAQEIAWALTAWVVELALLLLYFDRVAVLEARDREPEERRVGAAPG